MKMSHWQGAVSTCLGAMLCLTGCASTPMQVVKLDPLLIEAVVVDGEKRVEVLDPELLFEQAGKAFQSSDYVTAAQKYGLIVSRFGKSRWANVSRYNGGLALERSGRCPEAVLLYDALIKRVAGSRDAQDALFRVATCHENTGTWGAARVALDRLLKPEFKGISAVSRLEAHALRGRALQELDEVALAERDYKAALALYKENIGQQVLQRNRYVSMAQFQIAEIYRELFKVIRIRLPVERMERDIEAKSNLFLKCQAAFLRTVRFQHPEYSVIAGFRLGQIFETFYDHLLSAEVPPDLDEEEIAVYYEELKDKIRPLVEKAVDIFERNLRLGQRMGRSGEWMRKTEASLERLRELMQDDLAREALRKAEEKPASGTTTQKAPDKAGGKKE
ncbi:MAG: tetratricopeptide repeat protein [Myxococcota bacterium]